MTFPTPDPRAVLTVPWLVAEPDLVTIAPAVPELPLVAEPDLVHQIAPALPLAAEPDLVHQNAPAPDLTPERRPYPFYATLAAFAAWCIAVAVMILTGAMFPLPGNVLAYLVLMAGLFCAAFTVLTCPRPDGEETFITLSGYPVGQCTPSRNTLTGRGDR